MKAYLFQWIVAALSLLGTAYFLPGFKVRSFGIALLAAIVIGFANMTIGPILQFLAFPLTFLTLGLFTWVVNAVVLKICAAITPGFDIASWGSALLGAILIAILSNGIYWLVTGI